MFCQFCKVLSQDQTACLATPSYHEKKEKRDQKAIQDKLSSIVVDPASVTVVGVAKGNLQASSTPDMKARKRQSSEESNRSTKYRKADSSVLRVSA